MNVDIEPSDQYFEIFIVAPNLKLIWSKIQETGPESCMKDRKWVQAWDFEQEISFGAKHADIGRIGFKIWGKLLQ